MIKCLTKEKIIFKNMNRKFFRVILTFYTKFYKLYVKI